MARETFVGGFLVQIQINRLTKKQPVAWRDPFIASSDSGDDVEHEATERVRLVLLLCDAQFLIFCGVAAYSISCDC